MKYIGKGQEPERFTAWKAMKNEDWQPNWDALRSPEKPAVHQASGTADQYISEGLGAGWRPMDQDRRPRCIRRTEEFDHLRAARVIGAANTTLA